MTSDIHSIDVLAIAALPDGVTPGRETLDVFYTVLADSRRRRLLDHLASVGETTFGRLVNAFADECPTREQLANLLYHVHLAKLDRAGMVDSREGTIVYDPPTTFERFYEAVRPHTSVDDTESHLADEGFDLLADARRREMLRLLEAHQEVSLPDVADEVAVVEEGTSIVNIDPDTVLDVYLALYHDHVPRLVSAGLVDYDQEHDLLSLKIEGASHAASALDD